MLELWFVLSVDDVVWDVEGDDGFLGIRRNGEKLNEEFWVIFVLRDVRSLWDWLDGEKLYISEEDIGLGLKWLGEDDVSNCRLLLIIWLRKDFNSMMNIILFNR